MCLWCDEANIPYIALANWQDGVCDAYDMNLAYAPLNYFEFAYF